ncbi:putative translation elongation factor G2 [Aureobasidium pullulans]|uniref:Ribosome-releasing factor 2, mitochondrial n=1 Tax=Aureobasidium pullulans TaxID=5580 RepID=A0A4S9LYH2_AURPU|nr:putative translation elongation factor G2 [Aureobasidium pullulans]
MVLPLDHDIAAPDLTRQEPRAVRSFASSTPRRNDLATIKTRNIGIIAHIDAKSYTYTESALDVDEGSTVTDFLPAERARGITIQSAAVTFSWPPANSSSTDLSSTKLVLPRSTQTHNVNLIDTPGHADFTFEVLRSLRILDGAVCILDGVAGVEAQTEKVWTQATNYHIPKILFVNKLDREGAAFARTISEIGTRLHVWPALCQIPWWRPGDLKLQGVGDAVGLRALLYEEGGDGKTVKVHSLKDLEAENSAFAEEIKKARTALVELLSEYDDEMVEKFLEYDEDHLAIPSVDITESLRRCTLQQPQKLVPVFSGASFRNVGVQPLLDAVVDLLPSPQERPDPEASVGPSKYGLNDLLTGKASLPAIIEAKKQQKTKALAASKNMSIIKNLDACALAFKVVTDPRRGVLVYVRVYSGSITKNAPLFNTNLGITEKAPRLLRMYADEAVEISSIEAGQIGVIPGLKSTRTGDTLILYSGVNPKVGPPSPINTLQLRPITVPPPVFFTSVEPNSLAEEKHISETLALLLREDPSLNVREDPESGQTHLAGMGELHLEIARDRLINDLKAKARIGNIQIGYREALSVPSSEASAIFDREVAGKASKAGCIASVAPFEESELNAADDHTHVFALLDENYLVLKTPTLYTDGSATDAELPPLPATLPMQMLQSAMQTGATAALARGPSHGYPLHSTKITITFDPSEHLFQTTNAAAISSAARLAVQKALREAADAGSGTALMEPVMNVTITVDEPSLGSVVHDISSARGGQVMSLGADDETGSEDDMVIDPTRIYSPPDPFGGSASDIGAGTTSVGNQMRQIVARVPLKEMVGYLKHLRSLTQGRGTFVMTVDRFEKMNPQRMKLALAEMSGGF